ncbi:hypothetical protein HYW20_00330 [Candidatus Woesearchaeota archaeon]|nr:hypothetical protein [Candidatus Woesearchaeota archaeon]
MEVIVKVKKIGGSVGVILPKRLIEKEHIMAEDEIELKIKRMDNFDSLWGIIKDVKIPTQKIMDIIDEGEDFD